MARLPVYVQSSVAKYITSNDIERMVSEKGTDSVFEDGNDSSEEENENGVLQHSNFLLIA